MSDLPSDALSYQAVVAEYFLGLRGSGLLLSPLDQELIAEWERRGLPVAVVCRGLRRGLERFVEERAPHVPLPRSLRAYRFAVEDEWRAYRAGRVGESPAPSEELAAIASRLEAALSHIEAISRSVAQSFVPIYREAHSLLENRALAPPASLATVDRWLAEIDDRLLSGWLYALPQRERAALGPRCRLLAGVRPAGTRPGAYREALRAHLWDSARAAGLVSIRGAT
jgi:hypothetical protein